MNKVNESLEKSARELLKSKLSQCTEEQQKFFERMYPGGPEKISFDKISWAITQCENTIRKNLKEPKQ